MSRGHLSRDKVVPFPGASDDPAPNAKPGAASPPYMPLYIADLRAATDTWPGEEAALFVHLVTFIWSKGPLPIDERELCRIAGYDRSRFRKLWSPRVSAAFTRIGSGLVWLPLEERREEAGKAHQQRLYASALGVEARRKARDARRLAELAENCDGR